MEKDAFAEKDDAMTGWSENLTVRRGGRGRMQLGRRSSTWVYDINGQANWG